MVKIALIGCTGNIGGQVAEVVRRYPDKFCFSALVSGTDGEGLRAMAREFSPAYSACAAEIPEREILKGAFDGCDVAFIAAGGFAGLAYSLRAAELGKKIALANKESLVCGGELLVRTASSHGAEIVPVDSEHSALFQALSFRRDTPFEKLILTASGGPFFRLSESELSRVTAKDALKHPTWNMGAKITVDCATLLNKGYEIIEAKWLYEADFGRIEAVVHPESIVHSLVSFADGAVMAQLSYPDMRLPIQLALTYPERLPCLKQLNLCELGSLHFYGLPQEKFPCFALALEAGKRGGTAPTVLNGSAEVAVKAFLNDRISFLKIAETIRETLERVPAQRAEDYETLRFADAQARETANKIIYGN